MTAVDDLPELVLCIPGPWKDKTALLTRIVECSGGYLAAGGALLNMETRFACDLEHAKRDSRMLDAFRAAGPHWRDTPEMQAIEAHESVAYLIGKGGSRRNAESMMLAAAGLVRAGGLGVKVESSGVAHSPDKWLDLTGDLALFTAHHALVLYVAGHEIHSCGMHNFGLRDAIVAMDDQSEALELLREFTRYLFAESPVIRDGQTFASDTSAPAYRIRSERAIQYNGSSLFNNPYGAWRLVPLARDVVDRPLRPH